MNRSQKIVLAVLAVFVTAFCLLGFYLSDKNLKESAKFSASIIGKNVALTGVEKNSYQLVNQEMRLHVDSATYSSTANAFVTITGTLTIDPPQTGCVLNTASVNVKEASLVWKCGDVFRSQTLIWFSIKSDQNDYTLFPQNYEILLTGVRQTP